MEIRCPECNKLILKGTVECKFKFEIVCSRCKTKFVTQSDGNEYNIESFVINS